MKIDWNHFILIKLEKEINDEFGEDEKDNEKLNQFITQNHY